MDILKKFIKNKIIILKIMIDNKFKEYYHFHWTVKLVIYSFGIFIVIILPLICLILLNSIYNIENNFLFKTVYIILIHLYSIIFYTISFLLIEAYFDIIPFLITSYKNAALLTKGSLIDWIKQKQQFENEIFEILGEEKVSENLYDNLEIIQEKFYKFKKSKPRKFNQLYIYIQCLKESNSGLAAFNIFNAVIGGVIINQFRKPNIKFVNVLDVSDSINICDIEFSHYYINNIIWLFVFIVLIRIIYKILSSFNNFRNTFLLKIMDSMDNYDPIRVKKEN